MATLWRIFWLLPSSSPSERFGIDLRAFWTVCVVDYDIPLNCLVKNETCYLLFPETKNSFAIKPKKAMSSMKYRLNIRRGSCKKR